MHTPTLETVTTRKEAAAAIKHLSKQSTLGLDTETTGLKWWVDKLVGISASSKQHAFYFPFRHVIGDEPSPLNLPHYIIGDIYQGVKNATHVGANLNFDRHILKRCGWRCGDDRVPYHDATLAAYSLQEVRTRMGLLNIEALAEDFLGVDSRTGERKLMAALSEVLGRQATKKDKGEMYRVDARIVGEYACLDAWHPLALLPVFTKRLKSDQTWNSYIRLLAQQRLLFVMAENGMPVLENVLSEVWREAEDIREEKSERLRKETGIENLGSSVQVKAYLQTLHPEIESTKKADLEHLAGMNPDTPVCDFVDDLLSYRRYSKACSTYYQAISDNQHNGILHPNLRITGALVRMSANNPNTQAIPREGKAEYRVKEIFGFPDGGEWLMMETDLSQAEIAMAAHITGDPALVAAIVEGQDNHKEMQRKFSELFGREIPRVTAKAVNFAAQYGCGPVTLAGLARVSIDDAKGLLKAHKELYPRLNVAYLRLQKVWKQQGYLRIWSGRKRHLHYSDSLHTALNAVTQGGVTEMLRECMGKLDERVPEFIQGLTVHDCVVGRIRKQHVTRELVDRVQAAMTDFPWLKVPIKASVEVGYTWGSVVCADKWLAQRDNL